ncbi:MAG: 16S rRNA (cytosine(1402)-N(4))-methyltransferase RsmH [Oscillospiraceae bacterium]|jgi:16S rRNA (cytosine1402-N4)-methyltransferase|nr:16S rRNA (cytosine(1402)-N(4))-methyltransferase RsmH [Oscillospiraceae bacterium]
MTTPDFRHETVLLHETVDALHPHPGGIWLDGTAGGGGHTALLLEHIRPGGRILALDRDPAAVAVLHNRFAGEPAVTVMQGNFFAAPLTLAQLGFAQLDGALLDLGVSSPQLDTPERGFSYHHEAPLDMRMEQSGPSAADLVNTLPEAELRALFWEYGQERFAGAMAGAIVKARAQKPIETTTELAELLSRVVPAAARRDGHPARRAFMALRYACNRELDGLEDALRGVFELLRPGGRLAVIGFNSLEDAALKRAFRPYLEGCTCPPEFPVCLCGKTPGGRFAQKPRLPGSEELARNPRARSAKLRVIEKIK